MAKEQDVSLLGRRLAVSLLKVGASLLKSSFNIEPEIIVGQEMVRKFQDIPSISYSDRQYYSIPLAKWKEIIDVDWTNHKKYIVDRFDCDNFAFYFASSMAMQFGLNTCGVAYGKMGDEGHAFNVIYATDGIKILEPQTDDWVDYTGGNSVTLRGKTYSINWIIFF